MIELMGITGFLVTFCSMCVWSKQQAQSWNAKSWKFEAFWRLEGSVSAPPFPYERVRLHLCIMALQGINNITKKNYIKSDLKKKKICFLQGNTLCLLNYLLLLQEFFCRVLISRPLSNVSWEPWGHLLQTLNQSRSNKFRMLRDLSCYHTQKFQKQNTRLTL